MPLQNLVEYFNNRFEQEHHVSFRPFILDNGSVSGLFGPLRIDTHFAPIRKTQATNKISGVFAKLNVSSYEAQPQYVTDLENLLTDTPQLGIEFDSIVNFDRLSRTVHMLNFLPLTHQQDNLFLTVDPRHILSIKHDHGAYFGEVIEQCGLTTQNVVIVLAANSQYARYHQELTNGLKNYRRRGYRLALRFDYLVKEQTFEFIQKLSPDYVGLSVKSLNSVCDSSIPVRLRKLTSLVKSTDGQSILLDVDQKRSEFLAINAGFDWVQGSHYEQPAFPWLSADRQANAVRHY
jgi:EAL domain-containing protein (putative c-di-GMP-specific phosphodiesterase class I)